MIVNDRRAFTLVELLVVIAIIGILVATILPAIQAAREASRRNLCTSKMRDLILAIHNYELAEQFFPPGTVNDTGPIENLPVGQDISWIARLLPYIDEQNKYRHLDLAQSAYAKVNDDVRRMTIPLLICPSDPNNMTGKSSYAGCHHDLGEPIDFDNNGVFFLDSQLSSQDIEDGLSYTIFLGEKCTIEKFDLGWLAGTPSTLRNAGSPLNLVQYPPPGDTGPAPWLTPIGPGEDAEDVLPHSKLGGNPKDPLYVGGFGSYHPGGAYFAFGNGSVRFLADDIPLELLQQLANRKDGGLIDDADL